MVESSSSIVSAQLPLECIDFGKHRGKLVSQVDAGYLGWMLDSFSQSHPWWQPAANALTTRRLKSKQHKLVKRSVHALVSGLKCCTRKRDLHEGKRLHASAVATGMDSNTYVAAALISMYTKCGSMVDARTVFDTIQEVDVVSWTALLLGYAENRQGVVALDLFSRMKLECTPDSLTYVAVLKACSSLAADGDGTWCLVRGREIHSEIGSQYVNHYVQSALIDMYAKCGSIVEARRLFDSFPEPNLVSWNALLQGYVDNGQALAALELFSRMKLQPDSVTYVVLLKACTLLAADGDETEKQGCLERCRQIHLKMGSMDHFVQSALIDLYAKCGSMADARKVFDDIQDPDVVSWTALILGYADNGQALVALNLFSRMNRECKCALDSVTYVAALKACGSIGALATGRRLLSNITTFDAHTVTCLVDFYANCGSLEEAREVFNLHSGGRNVATWNALLAGYSSFGDTGSVFDVFEAMRDQGFQPNAVTFVCLLSCCSHAGLIEKAWEYLEVMPTLYGVTPTVRHYTCMIDLLGRANKLDEAAAVLRGMPCDVDAVTWMTLLGACRKWSRSALGRLAYESLMDLDQENASAHLLMAEIYGTRGMWEEQERVLSRQASCVLQAHPYFIDPGD